MAEVIKYHRWNPNLLIEVSAGRERGKYRIGYVTTRALDEPTGLWGVVTPYGSESFRLTPTRSHRKAIAEILALSCCADFTRDNPLERAA